MLFRSARRLGVQGALATELQVGPDGRCTGHLDGPNCRGHEKVERLRRWLGGRSPRLWAYGDSSGDDELLAMADHPVRVHSAPIPEVPL